MNLYEKPYRLFSMGYRDVSYISYKFIHRFVQKDQLYEMYENPLGVSYIQIVHTKAEKKEEGTMAMRPLYETQQDRDNEAGMARIIEGEFSCSLTKMPIKLSLDYMATRNGSAVAFIEARQRKTPMQQYPTYMISLYKVMMASALTQTTGLPCFLAVQWSDRTGICRLPSESMDVRIGGSTRRGDAQDIEPMAYFDVASFKAIGGADNG